VQVHHKIKRSKLGKDSLDNLVTLCANCNMAEHGPLGYAIPSANVRGKPKLQEK
jgi:5-methylcytosine-specific restriction endonuclease McrA